VRADGLCETGGSLPSGGVQAELQRSEDSVDRLADAIDRIDSVYSLKANVISLRTADKMLGTVLNLKTQPALASAWPPRASGKLP
jgi:hypothetical protein